MPRILLSGIIAFLLLAQPSVAQEAIVSDPCPYPEPQDFQQVSERLNCIEQRFDELIQMQNLLLKTQQNLVEQLGETAAKIDYDIYGPPKALHRFDQVKLAVTHGYWAGGQQVRAFNCVPPLEAKLGMTLIGGTLSKQIRLNIQNWAEYGGNSRGCAPAPFCDSAGEFCNVQSRTAGCYVSTAWYTWYTEGQKRKSLPISQAEICAE